MSVGGADSDNHKADINMGRDRFNRILVRFLILLGCVFFWGAVLLLIVSCKAQRSVEREVLTNNVKTEDVKSHEETREVVSLSEIGVVDEKKDYDVTITVLSAPDSTGKQYAQKVVNVKAKEERATTTAKDSVSEAGKLRASYEQVTSESTSESKEDVNASAGGLPPPSWWWLLAVCVVVGVFVLRINKR